MTREALQREALNSKEVWSDTPISNVKDDTYNLFPFAELVGKVVAGTAAPDGLVLGVTGAWGSGKSSAINLMVNYLKENAAGFEVGEPEKKNPSLEIIRFNPWWIEGREQLVDGFLRHLRPLVGEEEGLQLLANLAKWLRPYEKVGATAANVGTAGLAFYWGAGARTALAAGTTAGKVAEAGLSYFNKKMEDTRLPAELYAELRKTLLRQKRRFLVILDDLDRLEPAELLLMLRLVKTVGQLPNVIYLLAYDRERVDALLAKEFPSEGPQYLEKIVQAEYAVPAPETTVFNDRILITIAEILKLEAEDIHEDVDFWNRFWRCLVNPGFFKTPRDIIRYGNQLRSMWPVLQKDVYIPDFFSVEAFHLFWPGIIETLRQNKTLLMDGGKEKDKAKFDKIFLSGIEDEDEKERFREALSTLFPRLKSVWENYHLGDGRINSWARRKQIQATGYFETYFRRTTDNRVIKGEEQETILSKVDDRKWLQSWFREAINRKRFDGVSFAAAGLEMLNERFPDISNDKVPGFLKNIFEIVDELDMAGDEDKEFMGVATNKLRLHWLLNNTKDTLNQEQRAAILIPAIETASIGWAAEFTERCWREHNPRKDDDSIPEKNRFLDSKNLDSLVNKVVKRLWSVAKSKKIFEVRSLFALLFDWRNLEGANFPKVKTLLDKMIASHEEVVVRIVDASFGVSKSHSGDDTIIRRRDTLRLQGVEFLFNVERLAQRVDELIGTHKFPKETRDKLLKFKKLYEDGSWREGATSKSTKPSKKDIDDLADE